MTIHDAIEFFGRPVDLARACGVTRQAVNVWLRDGELPPLRQAQIQLITKNKLKADKSVLGM